MSFVHHEVSEKQVAANQANAQKSTGPKTPEGKARVALNSIKHGAYARADNSRRQIMLRRGEDPAEYERLHQDLADSWQPDDSMQAMVVKTIGDKTWEKLQLGQACLDAQLVSMELAQAQAHRGQLQARRWLRAVLPGASRGFCGTQDSPEKFEQIFRLLDRLQEWFEKETCPDEYPDLMDRLYGDFPTVAGQRIGELFRQLFDDDEAVCEKARQELPNRIGQEKSDVQHDRELYYRELGLRAKARSYLPEEKVAAKEAALERQIAEQIRLLLQLKSKRSLWAAESEAGEAFRSGTSVAPVKPGHGQDGHATNSGVHSGASVSPVNESPSAAESEAGQGAASAGQSLGSSRGRDPKGDEMLTGESPVPPRKPSLQGPIAKDEAAPAGKRHVPRGKGKSRRTIAKDRGMGSTEGAADGKNGRNGQTKPSSGAESTT